MKHARIISVLLVAAILASGCVQTEENAENNSVTEAPPAPKIQPPAAPPAEENVVSFASAPESAIIGDFANITWSVKGTDEKTNHTAIHFDYKSHPGNFGTNMTVKASGYEKLTPEYANGSYTLPKTFSAKIQLVQTGNLFYRAHAVVGGKNYWTKERNITITPKPAEVVTERRVIDADGFGFYSNNRTITAISVSFGHIIDITFNAKETMSGGLNFKGCGTSAEGVWAGNSAEIEFNANTTCNITSYDVVSGAKKASLEVKVGKPYSMG